MSTSILRSTGYVGRGARPAIRSRQPRLRPRPQRRNQTVHSINYYGSCAAALVYNRHRMGAKLDRVIASLQHNLDRDHDSYPYW